MSVIKISLSDKSNNCMQVNELRFLRRINWIVAWFEQNYIKTVIDNDDDFRNDRIAQIDISD